MAAVTINTGEAYHEDRLSESPREKWGAILAERRYYLETNIDYDCRCLLQYVAEAEEFYAELGYDSAEAMVQEAYGIQSDKAWAAVAYLQGRQAAGLPDLPMGLSTAAKGELHAAAALAGELGLRPAAGAPPMNERSNPDNVRIEHQGNSAAYLAARLKKAGRDDLLEQIGPGKQFSSMRAAAIEAGIIKPVPTVRLTNDMPAVAARLCQHLTREQRIELIDLLAPDL